MTDDDVFRWENPPPDAKGRNGKSLITHELIASRLRGRPGHWALIHTTSAPSAIPRNITLGRIRAYAPAGTFQAVSRRVGDEFRIYVRFVGEVAGQ